MNFRPRPYQAEAVAAVIAGHAEHQSVIGRGATGLGKAAILAMLAQHYAQAGRVMVLVDVVRLVHQLADTFEWVTGERPGIEMGETRAFNGGLSFGDKIVISTFQTQYSGSEGNERYRRFKADEFSCLLVDECESVFPTDTASRSVVDWYMTNPNIKVFGCTATPFRSDGIAAANLFGHVAFDYDILWGMENGWLVPARQAMVRVSVDFSTLKIRDTGDGEKDYSPEEIASKISDESTLIEIAKGILAVAEDRKSIVACPNVATARAVSHYLQGERNGCAQCIFGELGDEVKADIFSAFDRNEFQFLTSVMMLTKGFDQPDIRAVFNCRKTKSKRLYQQLLGRGTRPLKGLLDDLGDAPAEARRAAIAASAKPNMLMCNLVGVNEEVRDVTVTDILGSRHEEDVVERAKELQADDEDLEAEAALELAAEQLELEREAQLVLDEIAQQEADAADDRFEAELRRRAEVQAHVEVEYQDDLGAVATVDRPEARIEGPTPKQQQLLAKQVYPEDLARLSPPEQRELARRIVIRMQQGLCSYKQAKILQRNGYTREQTLSMRRDQAKQILDHIFAARGKR